MGQPLAEASKVPLTHKAPLAAGIMLLMIAAMVFNWVTAVAAVLIAAVLMAVSYTHLFEPSGILPTPFFHL